MKTQYHSRGLAAAMSVLAILALLGSSLAPYGARIARADDAETGPPYGYHDGLVDEGTCTAFGWAVDPDDRDRDVAVQILADGAPVAAGYAGDYGEDMEANNLCPGGTCRFTIPLWDVLSHAEEHVITAQAYDEETDAWVDLAETPRSLTCQETPPPPPAPWLTAFPAWEYVEAVDWAVGADVHLAIDDPGTPEWPDYQADTTTFIPDWEPNPERGWALFPLEGYDLKTDDVVMMTGGGFELTHVVRYLTITGVDMDADTVAGMADPGTPLQAWVHGQPEVDVTAGDDGAWLADFTGFFDITYGTGGRAWIIGEGGNATAVSWDAPPPPPTPWLIAFPENDAIEGWEWPLGATVHLAIDDPATEISPDFEADGIAAETWWGDPRTFFRLDFGGAYDLKPGDLLVLTDGAATAMHVVQNLSVVLLNGAADFIAGTAAPGAHLQVWPHGFDQTATLEADTGPGGRWRANFRGVFDLVLGTGGRAWIVAEGGNATAVDWMVMGPAGPTTTQVRLPADAGWLDTGLMVWEGVPVVISAQGQARTGMGQGYGTSHSGPDGQTWTCPAWEGMPPCALDGATYGALVGRIGEDGEPFYIGSSFVLWPNADGLLYLAVNDNLPYYADNRGNYMVFLSS